MTPSNKSTAEIVCLVDDDSGVFAFLTKPFDADEFLVAVRGALAMEISS